MRGSGRQRQAVGGERVRDRQGYPREAEGLPRTRNTGGTTEKEKTQHAELAWIRLFFPSLDPNSGHLDTNKKMHIKWSHATTGSCQSAYVLFKVALFWRLSSLQLTRENCFSFIIIIILGLRRTISWRTGLSSFGCAQQCHSRTVRLHRLGLENKRHGFGDVSSGMIGIFLRFAQVNLTL